MSPKTIILLGASAAALILPAAASAQPYYGQPAYSQPHGDYNRRHRDGQGVYPQFRGIEQHIRSEIYDGVRQDLLQRDDAQDLLGQLRDIQAQEWREYRVHGWNLPYDDQARIQQRLAELDRLVDQTRDEQ